MPQCFWFEHHSVSTICFGRVKGCVGSLKNLINLRVFQHPDRANAHRDGQPRAVVDHFPLTDDIAAALRDALCLFGVNVAQHDREFIPAQSGEHVTGAQILPDLV